MPLWIPHQEASLRCPDQKNRDPVVKLILSVCVTRVKHYLYRQKRWLRWFFQLALLAGFVFVVHLYQIRNTVRGEAPEFSARLLDGSSVSLYEFRGQPLLLQFWATWCPVCSIEQGSIDAIARDYAVLSVALDEASADEILEWMSEKGVSYAVIRDPAGRVSGQFGVQGVPTSIILDASGEIRFVEVGYTTELGLRLRLWWVDV